MAIPDSPLAPNSDPEQRPTAGIVGPVVRGSTISGALDSVTDSVQLIDPNWRTVYLNKAARRTLREQGIDPDSVIGRHFWDEIYADARGTPLQRAYMHAMQAREVTELENYYPPWQRWFWVRVFPVNLEVKVHSSTEAELLGTFVFGRSEAKDFRELPKGSVINAHAIESRLRKEPDGEWRFTWAKHRLVDATELF